MSSPEIFQHEFMQRALLAAVIIGLCNGFISSYVVLNKSALIMNALSHSLLPGVAIAALVFAGISSINAFFGALCSALVISVTTFFISKNSAIDKNTILAILYTFTFAIGVFIIQYFPVKVDLENWLFGNILGISNFDLKICLVSTAIVIGTLLVFQRPLIISLFEASVAKSQGINTHGLNIMLISLLTLSLISTIQAVGCALAIGLMTAPGAIAQLFSSSPQKNILLSTFIGLVIASTSILISYYLDAPPGALMIIVAGGLFILALATKNLLKFIGKISSLKTS